MRRSLSRTEWFVSAAVVAGTAVGLRLAFVGHGTVEKLGVGVVGSVALGLAISACVLGRLVEETREPELRTHLQILRRRVWIVVLLTLVGVAGGLGYSFLQTAQYTAAAEVLLQPTSPPNIGPGALLLPYYVPLVTSAPVEAAVANQLHVAAAPAVVVSLVAKTNVLRITATSASPRQAADIANAYARAYVHYSRAQLANNPFGAAEAAALQEQISILEHQIATTGDPSRRTALSAQVSALQSQLLQLQMLLPWVSGGPQQVAVATPPSSSNSPSPRGDAAIGSVIGLVVGLGLAFLAE